MFGGANGLIAVASSSADDDLNVHATKGDALDSDATDERESPLTELDPERKYKSEALLSYKSSLAPYGKIIGIRLASSSIFTPVQNWNDVEEFVKNASADRVVVKLQEPWGAEVIANVGINRKAYPAVTRPAEPPVSSRAVPAPRAAEKPALPKPEPKTVLITDSPVKTELAISASASVAETSQASGMKTVPTSGVTLRSAPQLIEPSDHSAFASRTAPKAISPIGASPVARPAIARVEPGPRPVSDLGPRLVEPTAAKSHPVLTAARPNSVAVAGAPSRITDDVATPVRLTSSPKLIEPSAALVRPAATRFDPYQLMLLSSRPFMPRADAPQVQAIATPAAAVAAAPQIGTGRVLARLAKSPTTLRDDQANEAWLQGAVDAADRLGILSCKPLVTSDRRQQAFALYTLYMGLKDLRAEIDHRAKDLNKALGSMSIGHEPSESEMRRVVTLGRSYEKAMNAILAWDAESTKGVIRAYTAELRTMDEVRSMLAFLSGMKKEPGLIRDLRTISGMEQLGES